MRKPKKRQQGGGLAMNDKGAAPLTGLSNSETEVDSSGEDGWVMVKKQRVIILVPPLAVANEPTMQEPVPAEHQAIPTTAVNDPLQHLVEIPTEVNLVENHKMSKPLALRLVQEVRKETSDLQAVRFEPSNLDLRVQSGSPDQVGFSRDCRGPLLCNTLKPISRPRFPHGSRCLLQGSSLNQRMRMTNLEKKLGKAGGLSKWLASQGLNQFIKIFERRSFSRFELVNLTMKKLEDMGASAVGPRRKLMHAISCLC